MFGRETKLQRKLEKGEARHEYATVLEATLTHQDRTHGVDNMNMSRPGEGRYRVRANVEPDGEPAFEATFDAHVEQLELIPKVGERFPVIYDPSDRDEVAWDFATASDDRGAKLNAETPFNTTLSAEELTRFRASIVAALETQHEQGKLTDAELAQKRAEVEADPTLRPPSGT